MLLGDDEFPLKEGVKERLSSRCFTANDSSSMKTFADRHGLTAYHNNHTANKLFGGTNTDDFERS